jgi:hypothetical protein
MKVSILATGRTMDKSWSVRGSYMKMPTAEPPTAAYAIFIICCVGGRHGRYIDICLGGGRLA